MHNKHEYRDNSTKDIALRKNNYCEQVSYCKQNRELMRTIKNIVSCLLFRRSLPVHGSMWNENIPATELKGWKRRWCNGWEEKYTIR